MLREPRESTNARKGRRVAARGREAMTPAMINPVEQIVAARRRLKQVAALRAGLTLAFPALTALVLAATLHAMGEDDVGARRLRAHAREARQPARRAGARRCRGARRMRPDGLAGLARSR